MDTVVSVPDDLSLLYISNKKKRKEREIMYVRPGLCPFATPVTGQCRTFLAQTQNQLKSEGEDDYRNNISMYS